MADDLADMIAARVAAWRERAPNLADTEDDVADLRAWMAALENRLSPPAALALWRQLRAEAGMAIRLVIWGGGYIGRTVDAARQRFGAGPLLALGATPEAALDPARLVGTVAVLTLASDQPWWARIVSEPGQRVFAALPEAGGPPTALALALATPEPTGADITFWVTDAPAAPQAIAAALSEDGVAASLLAEAQGVKLFSLAGFYQTDDPRLARAPGRLRGVIGAATAALAV